jgi:hypothetical protein
MPGHGENIILLSQDYRNKLEKDNIKRKFY